MNCPSRTDAVQPLEHPTWNQSPPFLAPDLTTRQDLNGIANSRVRKGGGDDEGFNQSPSGGKGNVLDRPPDGSALAADQARRSHENAWQPKTVANGDSSYCLSPGSSDCAPPSSWRSWLTWGLSVIVTSVLISSITGGGSLGIDLGHIAAGASYVDLSAQPESLSQISSSELGYSDGRDTASVRKRSTCGNNPADAGLYNNGLHIGAIFIILAVSTLACSFAMLAARFPGLRLPSRFFFTIRHFGTGVLIATAFVHLLPTAFIALGDECLPGFWTEDYPAMPGAIALAGIFLVVLVEMIFHPCRQIRPARKECKGVECRSAAATYDVDASVAQQSPQPAGPLRDMGPLVGRTISIGRDLTRVADQPDVNHIALTDTPRAHERKTSSVEEEQGSEPEGPGNMTSAQKLRKARMQCVLLELGILFHSVFIGMALSVSVGSEFVILLIAIAFHQTFEGLALGSRIAGIHWPRGTWQPWLMALAYGCTTPVGQAIGLATHTLYSPDSTTGLLLTGTMNAISAGLLTFASLVELLSEDFLSDDSWNVLRGWDRVAASLLVFGGAVAMSVVGAWA